MENKKLFDPILDEDEKIQEIFTPNFLRFTVIPSAFYTLIVLLFCLPAVLVFAFEDDSAFLAIPIGGFAIFFGLLMFLISFVSYSKAAYCYTNKRIIIRSGFIGVDYHAIDFDLIGGMDVHVDFMDKFIRPNTGSIVFASAASPIIQQNQKVGAYSFKAIDNPYEVYKRVKAYSSKNKDGQFNS